MKKLLVILMVLVSFGNVSFGQDAQENMLLDSAKSLYDAGEYDKSVSMYLSFSDSGVVSEALFYNLGNCYFKLGDKAHAVLYYEKALKLNSGNENAIHNLSVVNGTLIDKFEKLPSFSVRPLFTTINSALSYNLLGVLSVLSLIFGVVLFFKMKKKGTQFTFSNSWLILVVAMFLYLWGAVQKSQVTSVSAGVVSINGMEVRSEPNNDATLLFELNEGTKVELVDHNDNWSNVKTKDGNQGWVEKSLLLEI